MLLGGSVYESGARSFVSSNGSLDGAIRRGTLRGFKRVWKSISNFLNDYLYSRADKSLIVIPRFAEKDTAQFSLLTFAICRDGLSPDTATELPKWSPASVLEALR